MRAVVQRVIDASVTVDGALKGAIARGLLVYLGVARDDTTRDADWLAEKTPNLRIFDDENGVMNLSLLDIVNQQKEVVNNICVNHDDGVVNIERPHTEITEGTEDTENKENNELVFLRGLRAPRVLRESLFGVLVISQFTLLGDARKGRRPTWDKAAPPEKARELYQYFIEKISEKVPCSIGEFQAHMKVTYTNDGPVTILLDSRVEK